MPAAMVICDGGAGMNYQSASHTSATRQRLAPTTLAPNPSIEFVMAQSPQAGD